MLLNEFERRMKDALGAHLEHATTASVREFVDQMQLELWREEMPAQKVGQPVRRIDISDRQPATYESVMREFFARALKAERDQKLIELWLLALDLAYSGIEEMHSERLRKLFEE